MQINPDIVIPCAGLGMRMSPLYTGPKALLSLGIETVIARQIRLLRKRFPASQIIIVGGYEIERLKNHLPKWSQLVINEQYESTGVARSIAIGLEKALTRSVLVVYGDLVFNEVAISGINVHDSCVLVDSRSSQRGTEVGVVMVDDQVTSFGYGLPWKWGQIVTLAGPELHSFIRIGFSSQADRQFGFEVLNSIIEKGGSFQAYVPSGLQLVEIDTERDRKDARLLAQHH